MNMVTGPSWNDVAAGVTFEHIFKDRIFTTFMALNDDFKRYPNAGACHLLSGVFHVLLKEQDIESSLCIGEVQRSDKFYFDHSWVEIEELPFDIAIQLNLNGEQNAPVFAGCDLDTGMKTRFNYRFKQFGLSGEARMVQEIPFNRYMDGAPKGVGWDAVERIGKVLGLKLNVSELRIKHQTTKRILV